MKSRTRRTQRPVEGSWVVEGSDSGSSSPELGDDETDTAGNTQAGLMRSSLTSAKSPRKTSATTAQTKTEGSRKYTTVQSATQSSLPPQDGAEPDLVMPSLSNSFLKKPWFDETSVSAMRDRRLGRKGYGQTGRQAPPTTKSTNLLSGASQHGEVGKAILLTAWEQMIKPVLNVLLSFISTLWIFMRPIMAFVLALWILAYGLTRIGTPALKYALSPICSIPGSSYLNLPFCSMAAISGPLEFDQLMTVQSTFEDVLVTSAGGASLPVDMKRSESSVRDLKHLVTHSRLPSKNQLVFEFVGFIDTARLASADLTRFNSRIGHAVDQVISTNRWTLQVLDNAFEKEKHIGSFRRLLDTTILLPFRHVRVTEALLLDQYIRHAQAIEEEIAELILQAQALLGILENLDDRLDVIQSITTRDGITLQGDRDDLFAQLWTKLGGNRAQVKKSNEQLALLREVAVYRKNAWDHVSGTIIKLQSIAAGLEDLRERVGRPEVLGYRDDLPLRVHIENIQMGVDRLEQQRHESRRVENELYQRILGGSQDASNSGHRKAIDGSS